MIPNKKTRVLVVEDEALVAEMVRGLLEESGYTVIAEAADGREAIALTESLQPDVVLMDIEMPDLDGIEAARRIQTASPTPVVILTAHETPQLVNQASQAGVGAYLVKPPRARELERAITIASARFNDLMALRRLNAELEAALTQVKTLRGLLPICASCKKIRDDDGYWHQVEAYISSHSDATFTHGICPVCLEDLYPGLLNDEK